MLCQKCNKNEATVHIKRTVNGVVNEMMLCRECAEGEHATPFFGIGSGELFSGFFNDSIFGGSYIHEQKKCPLCNSTRADLAKSGRAGCAKCYEVFADELANIIYRIHGNARHTGAMPGNHVAQIEKQRKIEGLKNEQQKAIEEQNYEKAAELRDKIRAIEKGEDE